MNKKIRFEEWFLFTVLIMIALGLAIIIAAPILQAALEYKYSVHIVIYIAICGSIAYWILKKDEDSTNNK